MAEQRATMAFKAFLSQCSADEQTALSYFLSDLERQQLSDLPLFGSSEVSFPEDLLQEVHWSWFLPIFRDLSKKDQPFFLSALHETARQNVSQELGVKPSRIVPSATGSDFMRQVLTEELGEEVLPTAFLPDSLMNRLLYITKPEMMQLIDYLALYDLAHDIRQIVDTHVLKHIHKALSEEKRKFLKTIMAHQEPYPLPRLGLDKWDQTKEGLQMLLHKRGLVRLGVALTKESPDLIWHICHQLDIGRGSALLKYTSRPTTVALSDAIGNQIVDILDNPDIWL
ncbi:MAG: hypothetical protein RL235_585 [Chlamydiota bacterium]|jgi:hypothetical protein